MDAADDERFIEAAKVASESSPCFRSKVGAVIARSGKVLATGFNRPPGNQPDCRQIGACYRDENKIVSGTEADKCRAFGCHAESRAIASAARRGICTLNSTMYIHGNTEVCLACRGLVIEAGIKMVVYRSKHGEIEFVNTEYDWSINRLDQKKMFDDWKKNLARENGVDPT